MTSPSDPRVGALADILKSTRKRISLSLLAHLAGINPRSLHRYLQMRPVRDLMCRRGWTFTDSKTLGLPALEHPPYSLPYLVRNEPNNI